MLRYLAAQLVNAVIVLLLASGLTFGLIHSMPGGPAILNNQDLTASQAERLEESLGLNEPIYQQYATWLTNLLQGDMGWSLNSSRTVTSLVRQRLPNTILLGLSALAIAILVSIPLGIIAAVRSNSVLDHAISAVTFAGVSLPYFWFGLMLILLFSVHLGWLPSGGKSTVGASSLLDTIKHLIMPAAVLSISAIAQLTRYTRSAMLNVLRLDYMRTARSKGLPERRVLLSHGLRNAMITIVSVIGLNVARLVGGAAVIETVFAWPGMGQLMVSSALSNDYPVVMGVTVVMIVVVVIANLIVDLLYPLIDPRIKLT